MAPTPSFPDLSGTNPLPTAGRIVGPNCADFKPFFQPINAKYGVNYYVIMRVLMTLISEHHLCQLPK